MFRVSAKQIVLHANEQGLLTPKVRAEWCHCFRGTSMHACEVLGGGEDAGASELRRAAACVSTSVTRLHNRRVGD